MPYPLWAKALLVKPQDIDRWQAECPTPQGFLGWCLEQGKIDAESYLNWAANHFGLPIVRSDFFARSFDQNLFEQLRTVAPWSPSLSPIAQWDGVIYLACAEPPVDVKWSFTVQYVLAHPRDLSTYFAPNPVNADQTPPAPPEETVIGASAEPWSDDVPTQTGLEMPEGLGPEGLSLDTKPPIAPVLQFNFSAAPAPEAPAPDALAPDALAPSQDSQSAEFTAITRIASSLDFLRDDFKSSMILEATGDTLKPLLWDGVFKPQGEPVGPSNLTDPSAFRVVHRTKNPYLGHVVDTPINKTFFSAWGLSELPQKVLIQPILDSSPSSESSLVGIFVSICDEQRHNQDLLSAGSRHSTEILRLMKSTQGLPKAA
jgi:hypothetical protein